MEGITVLTEATPIGLGLTILILLSVFIAVIVISSFLVAYLGRIISDKIDSARVAVGLVAILFIGITVIGLRFAIISVNNIIDERDRSYKVLVDDTVSFNEFNAKYKVLKQDGEIFTVVEREVKENV